MKHLIIFGLFCLFIVSMSGCSKPVEIIAHRGASYLAPENTMASVMLGWEKNADVEVDVYLTKDKKIVAIHDKTALNTARGPTTLLKTAAPRSATRQLAKDSVRRWRYHLGTIARDRLSPSRG